MPNINNVHPQPLAEHGSHITVPRLLTILLLTFLTCSPLERVNGGEAANAAASTNAPILSGCEIDYPPYCFVTPDKQATGFSVELLRAALKAMGHAVTFKTGLWPEIMQDLVDGRLQVLPLVGRTLDREALFDFTFPYLTMHGAIVIREDTTGILAPADLKGRQVAVLQGDNAEEYLRRAGLGAVIVPLPSFETALRELSAGKHDAVVIQKFLAIQLIKQAGLKNLMTIGPPLKEYTQSFCFAVPKGRNNLLATINEGLAIVMADGTFRMLYAKWFLPLKAGMTRSRIVVGGDSNYAPYEFLDQNGQPAGYNVDLTRAIARKMGLTIDIRLKPWGNIRNELVNGDIDLVQGGIYSADRDSQFDFSPPHAIVQHAIVVRNGSPELSGMQDLAGKTIIVKAGGIMQDLVVKAGYAKQIVTVDSGEDALRLLAEGKHDCALVAKVPALYWIKKNGWHNLRVSDNSILSAEYCYAVLDQGNAELLAQFSEGLAALKSTGEYRQIYSKWLGHYDMSGISLRTILKYSLTAFLPLLALLIGSFLWLRSLKRQVASRTRDLTFKTALLDAQFNTTIDGVLVADNDGHVLLANTRFSRMWNIPPDVMATSDDNRMLEHVLPQLTDPREFIDRVKHLYGHREEGNHEEIAFKDGKLFERYSSPLPGKDGTKFGRIWFFRDITDRKRTEETRKQMELQLLREQKMSAIGTLASGAAHEINNPINGIINYAQLIKDRLDGDNPIHEWAGEIVRESERVANIIRQLQNFSQPQAIPRRLVRLAELVNETLPLIEGTFLSDQIAITADIAEDMPEVCCQPQQIRQVLMALLTNAREALNAKHPGAHANKTIAITGQQIKGAKAGEKRWTRLTVEDHGTGITAGNMEHIFDPFFTTKSRSKNAGLGLTTSLAIIRDHGGRLDVETEAGQWTRFHMDLPVEGDGGE